VRAGVCARTFPIELKSRKKSSREVAGERRSTVSVGVLYIFSSFLCLKEIFLDVHSLSVDFIAKVCSC